MPLLILHAILLGELVTGRAQTGKWGYLGPWWGGAGQLSLLAASACTGLGPEPQVAPASSLWQAVSEVRVRSSASSAEGGGPVPTGDVGPDSEG